MQSPWDALGPSIGLVRTELVEPREYQIEIARSISGGLNTLVVLPTGLGKTLIAVLAIARALHEGRRALILAPTKPLSEQHYSSLTRMLSIDNHGIALLTGTVGRPRRTEVEAGASVIVATPQTIANDLKSGRMTLNGFGIVVMDECHRAVGRYAYTRIADEAKALGVQLLGLTASPGSDRKRIRTLVDALSIRNIELRVSTDPDVAPYVFGKDFNVVYVDKTPTIERVVALLKPTIDEHLSKLYSMGLSPFKRFESMPKGRLIEIGKNINGIGARNYKFAALSNYIYVLDLVHAYDLAATEGLGPFVAYFDGLREREPKGRTVRSILSNGTVVSAIETARAAIAAGEEHAKVTRLASILGAELRDKSVIVFTQYRSTARTIVSALDRAGISCRMFVGRREGITQAQQKGIIDDFRDSRFRVLVATSIGEEGLDIPAVDAVVFYEPIPSEIRSIQRRGRAGRLKFGSVFVLVTRGTKDEAYLAVSRRREARMREILVGMKASMGGAAGGAGQKRLAVE